MPGLIEAVLAADMADRQAWLADALLDLTPAAAGLLRIAGELMERLAEDRWSALAT